MEKPAVQKCSNCWKEVSLCICKTIQSFQTHSRILVLQHPQEAKNPLGTARLTSLTLKNSVHRVGLSWRSLSAALGEEAESKDWAVLFLGALKDTPKVSDKPFQILTRKGTQVSPNEIKGIVILDGNWKQSKTLWWRNPWLLKLKRVVLNPTEPSMYGEVRKQPRKGCLSTIEAVAETLNHMGEKPEISKRLRSLFARHLDQVKDLNL